RDFPRFQGSTEEELLAWLRRLLLNNLADLARQFRGAMREVDRETPLQGEGSAASPAGSLAAAEPSPSGAAALNERSDAVHHVLDRLPDNYRQAIVWRYQEGKSFEEIGEAMGVTPNAARKLLLRAIRRAQEELGNA